MLHKEQFYEFLTELNYGDHLNLELCLIENRCLQQENQELRSNIDSILQKAEDDQTTVASKHHEVLKKYQETIQAIHQRVKKLGQQMEESEKSKAKQIRRA